MLRHAPSPDLPYQPRRLWTGCALLAVALALLVIGFHPVAHVQRRVGPTTDRAPWAWLDRPALHAEPHSTGSFEGVIRVPPVGTLWLENSLHAAVTLSIAGQLAYDGSGATAIPLPDGADAVAFTLTYAVDPAAVPDRGHLGFALDTAGVRVPAPAWLYLPDESVPTGVYAGDAARLLVLVIGLAGAGIVLSALTFARQTWLILAGILALSVTLRLVTLAQKFDADPGLWTMDTIWDNYVLMGRAWLAGDFPVGGTIYQQGMFILLGMLQMTVGPLLSTLYVAMTLAGGIGPVLLALAGWALFGRSTGVLAGLLAALFAPLIHYQHTLQIVAPATLCVFALLAAVAGMVCWRTPFFALAAGLTIGLGTVLRNSLLVMLALPLVTLLMQPHTWRTRFGYGALVIAAAGACIAPVTAANVRAGVYTLTANLGDYQLFRSNNLNSSGMNTYKTLSEQIAEARDDSWLEALRRDAERDPGRIVELTARRIALFWDPVEHSDSAMIDYRTTGLDRSSLLNVLALGGRVDFRLAMILAVTGLGLGALQPERRRTTLLVGLALGLYILSLALFYVIGRVRMPAAGIVLLLASVGLHGLWTLRRAPRVIRLRGAGVVTASVMLAFGMNALVTALPRPAFVSAGGLPGEVVPVRATYGGEIRLLGYAHYDSDFRPGGYIVFELFWQALRRPSADYVVTVRFQNNQTGDIDRVENSALGTHSTPERTSSTWPQDAIFYERYLFALPDVESADLCTYDLLVGLYDETAGALLPVTDAGEAVLDNHLRLTGAAVWTGGEPADSATSPVVWDDAVALAGIACTVDDSGLSLVLDWQTLRRPPVAWHVFVHVRQGDTTVEQHDAPPAPPHPTDSWPPGAALRTTWHAPAVTGPARILLGLYNPFTLERAAVSASVYPAADDAVLIDCPAS